MAAMSMLYITVTKDRTRHGTHETRTPVKAMAAVDCRTPSRPGSKTSHTQGRSWHCFCHAGTRFFAVYQCTYCSRAFSLSHLSHMTAPCSVLSESISQSSQIPIPFLLTLVPGTWVYLLVL